MQLYTDVHGQRPDGARDTGSVRRGSLMPAAARFNASGFSRWINGTSGRAFRLVVGAAWLVLAVAFRGHGWAIAAGVWSFFPITAGIFDICWISAAMGGPLSGRTIRAGQAVPSSS